MLPSDLATLAHQIRRRPGSSGARPPSNLKHLNGEKLEMRRLFLATLAASLAVLPGLRADAQTVVSSDVVTDTTWSGVVVLTKPIFVKRGGTLARNPGT